MAIETISISDLDRNGLQIRVALDESTVAEYAEAMQNRAKFPPVKVFCDGAKFYLADGFHRVEAAARAGFRKVKADTEAGSYVDALRFALSANAEHGLRRTNADKRRSLETAWEHRRELFGEHDPTAELLAQMCGVSYNTTQNFYRDLAASAAPLTPKRVAKDGKSYTVPSRPPTRHAPTAPVSVPPSRTVQSAPTAPAVRPGYYVGPDGREHAQGVEIDIFNVEIPERIASAFKTGAEYVTAWANRVNAVKNDIKGAMDAGFSVSVAQRVVVELDNAYHELKASLPFCVCRMCQGQGCDACRSTGYQTKDQYDRNPPEFKA